MSAVPQAVPASAQWAASGTSVLTVCATLPANYAPGTDVAFKLALRVNVALGTLVMRKSSFGFRDGDAGATSMDSAVNIDIVSPAAACRTLTATLPSSAMSGGFQAGDVVRLDISRLGSDAGDTNAGVLVWDGVVLNYTSA